MSGNKTTQKTNQTTTPTNPAWVDQALQGYTGKVNNFATMNAKDLVAGASPLQEQAFSGAAGLTTSPLFGEAAGAARSAIGSASIQDLMSPYTQNVVDTTLAGYDADAGRKQAQLAASGAANKGFGGSRFGVAEGALNADLTQGRAAAEAQLRDAAYQNAAGLFGDQQNRNLSAGGLLANIGSAQGADSRSNLGLQADLGSVQRGIDADYRTADLSMLQALGALYGQGQYGLFNGQNTTGTTTQTQNNGLLGSIGQGAQVGASLAKLFSDRRLKRNIVALGRGLYAYNYLWSDDVEIGVMADEQPHAASMGPGGFMTVDYGRL